MKYKVKVLVFLLGGMMIISNINVYALTAGGMAPGSYESQGGCSLDDRGSATVLVDKFLDYLKIYADATIKINYKNNNAWEQDMKPGKWNNDSIDDVEFMIYAGHGLAKGTFGLQNNALHFYTLNSATKFHSYENQEAANLTTLEAEWGKNGSDTRWVAIFSCNFLNNSDGYYNHMMQGINICMGFETKMYLDSRQGYQLAADIGYGNNIIDMFLEGCTMYQSNRIDGGCTAKVIYAENARNDTIYSYAYKTFKPAPIGYTTKYYSLKRTLPSK